MKSSFVLSLFLLLLTSFSLAQTGSIRGKVVNEDGEPLYGATVVIMEPEIVGAYTNEEGIFDLSKLTPGKYVVTATYFGYDSTAQEVTVTGGKVQTLKIVLRESGYQTDVIEITDNVIGKIETKEIKAGVTEITPEQIKIIPSIGSPDLAQYLQVLPGVVFTGDQGGQLYIRGGTPIQNMVLLDGMVVYSPFHSLGLFSVFDVDYIRTTDVYSAAFPAKYGGRVSSVMDIRTRNGNLRKFHAKANINPFTAGALLEGPIGKAKQAGAGISYLLSAKQNYIDKTSPILYPYIPNIGDTSAKGLPYTFTDIYGKITATDGINYANVFGFSHNDAVKYQFPANLKWNSYGGGANFQFLPSSASAIISGNFAYSQYKTGLSSTSEKYPRKSAINGFNGGLNMSYILKTIHQLNFGVTLLGFGTEYEFSNAFSAIVKDRKSNTELSFYASYKHVFLAKNVSYSTRVDSAFERFVLEPNIRLHWYNDQNFLSPEPRLRAKLNFNKFSVSAATGMFAQNLLSAQSDKDVVNIFQGFLSAPDRGALANATRSNSMQYAYHFLTGVEMELAKNLSTTVEGWYKRFPQIANINRDKIFPNDPNYIAETSNALGLDMILKYQTPSLYLYGTYGLSKVTRTDAKRTYYPVFDRRHTVNFVAAYKYGRFEAVSENGKAVKSRFSESKWEGSLRFALGSGFPFTQTQGYIEKLEFFSNGAQTDFATQNGTLGLILSDNFNGARLPYYHRLDLSVKRRWVMNNKMLLELSGNIINAYNRKNIFYFDRVRYVPVYQLPIIPAVGFSMTY